MAGDRKGPASLILKTYVDEAASPLGPALGDWPMLGLRLDDAPLETLPLAVEDAGATTRIRAAHPAGTEITITVESARVHNAAVWHLAGRQGHGGPGPRLHELRPLELVVDGAVAPDPVIHSWLDGAAQSFFPPDAVTPQSRVLYPGTPAHYGAAHFALSTRGGRSSDRNMPYFLITSAADSGGLWCAVGWSGNWSAGFTKPKGGVDLHVAVRIAPCDLRLPAGGSRRGPSMAVGLYRGDREAGCNALRRWLRSRMPPLLGGGDLSHFNTWTAMDADVDEARLLDAADRVGGRGLRYFMLDAGWYPAPRDNFSAGVGNWRVDPAKFPRGLEPVAHRVRAHDMGMGLWIEPERAQLASELARQHPEWLLTVPGSGQGLVNFALAEVRAHFRAVIADLVQRLRLGWLKWDFNMDPLPYWERAGDGGLAHLGHVDGVWETFDWVRKTFPDLVLENCASGGNRLDWTLFTRALVNFANDQYTHPDCVRRILGRMGAFLPSERLNMIFGPCQRRPYGDGDWQVLMGSAFGVSEPLDNWTDGFVERLGRHLALHRLSQPAQCGDFHRLTPDAPELRAWEGWQLHDPETGSGVVALWRAEAREAEATVRLRGLDAAAVYSVTDRYGGGSSTVPGREMIAGLQVSLPPAGAAMRAYRPHRPEV